MRNTDFGRRYFSKPPHKSPYFWLPTLWLLLILSMAIFVGNYYHRHRIRAGVGGGLWWMSLSVAAVIVLWVRAWRSHSKLHQISVESRGATQEGQSGLDMVLSQAASLEFSGLYIALLVLQSALIGFSKILGR